MPRHNPPPKGAGGPVGTPDVHPQEGQLDHDLDFALQHKAPGGHVAWIEAVTS